MVTLEDKARLSKKFQSITNRFCLTTNDLTKNKASLSSLLTDDFAVTSVYDKNVGQVPSSSLMVMRNVVDAIDKKIAQIPSLISRPSPIFESKGSSSSSSGSGDTVFNPAPLNVFAEPAVFSSILANERHKLVEEYYRQIGSSEEETTDATMSTTGPSPVTDSVSLSKIEESLKGIEDDLGDTKRREERESAYNTAILAVAGASSDTPSTPIFEQKEHTELLTSLYRITLLPSIVSRAVYYNENSIPSSTPHTRGKQTIHDVSRTTKPSLSEIYTQLGLTTKSSATASEEDYVLRDSIHVTSIWKRDIRIEDIWYRYILRANETLTFWSLQPLIMNKTLPINETNRVHYTLLKDKLATTSTSSSNEERYIPVMEFLNLQSTLWSDISAEIDEGLVREAEQIDPVLYRVVNGIHILADRLANASSMFFDEYEKMNKLHERIQNTTSRRNTTLIQNIRIQHAHAISASYYHLVCIVRMMLHTTAPSELIIRIRSLCVALRQDLKNALLQSSIASTIIHTCTRYLEISPFCSITNDGDRSDIFEINQSGITKKYHAQFVALVTAICLQDDSYRWELFRLAGMPGGEASGDKHYAIWNLDTARSAFYKRHLRFREPDEILDVLDVDSSEYAMAHFFLDTLSVRRIEVSELNDLLT